MIVAGLAMAVTLAGALIAVFVRKMVRAIFGLAVALIGVATLFLLLGSPFVASMEVLIYVGGISVAMVFAVMLSSIGTVEPEEIPSHRGFAGIAAFGFLASVGWSISEAIKSGTVFREAADVPASAWNVQHLGDALLQHYNLVFETLSVILLLAIIGAITIARKSILDKPSELASESTATIQSDLLPEAASEDRA